MTTFDHRFSKGRAGRRMRVSVFAFSEKAIRHPERSVATFAYAPRAGMNQARASSRANSAENADRQNGTDPSWPGLSRPSTSWFQASKSALRLSLRQPKTSRSKEDPLRTSMLALATALALGLGISLTPVGVSDAYAQQAKVKKPFCGMSCCLKRNANRSDRDRYVYCNRVTGGRESR
jgi:hypothetical protein